MLILFFCIEWYVGFIYKILIYIKFICFVNFFLISKGNGLYLKIIGKLKWVNKCKNIFCDSGFWYDFKKKIYFVNISLERLWFKVYCGCMNFYNWGSGDWYCIEVFL